MENLLQKRQKLSPRPLTPPARPTPRWRPPDYPGAQTYYFMTYFINCLFYFQLITETFQGINQTGQNDDKDNKIKLSRAKKDHLRGAKTETIQKR